MENHALSADAHQSDAITKALDRTASRWAFCPCGAAVDWVVEIKRGTVRGAPCFSSDHRGQVDLLIADSCEKHPDAPTQAHDRSARTARDVTKSLTLYVDRVARFARHLGGKSRYAWIARGANLFVA